MLNISEELKQNIEDIVIQVRDVERKIARADSLDADQSAMIAFSCAEIALMAFMASDELKEEGEIGDRLLQREISSALWSIALHCVEVQTWQDEFTMRMNVELMGQQCSAIIRMTGIPEPMPEEALVMHAPEDMQVPDGRTQMQTVSPAGPPVQVPGSDETSLAAAPPPEDQIQRLKIEIKALKEILAAMVLKRDNLLLVESKELESRYMKELGYLELEVYRAESDARYLQRKYEMMQAAMNRQEPINEKKIEETLNEKLEEFKKVYEEFRKKAKEAEETVRKRRQNAESAAEGVGKKSEKTGKVRLEEDDENRLPPGEEDEEDGQKEENDKGETAEEKGVSRLKKLYRKIVKAMHPDLHPGQDEKTKTLFKRAMSAYEEGDLQTLEEIAQVIDGGEEPENPEDLLAALLKEKERLLGLIQGIRAQITLILSKYPFTKKELLNDPVRLKAEQDKLKERLEHAKQRAEVYRKKIEELEKNGRADYQAE